MDVSIEPGLAYLWKVKSVLKDDHDYRVFIQVLLDFKRKGTNFSVVDSKLKEIFKQNKDLIMGFNAFLPDFYKIHVDDYDDDDVEETQIPIEYEECINLVNKIIIHFGDDQHHRLEAFLNLIDMCVKGLMDMEEVCGEINVLLADNPDVLYQILKLLLGCDNMKEKLVRIRKLSYCDVNVRGRLIETRTKKRKHVEKNDGGCNMTEILGSSSSSDGRGRLIETGIEKMKHVENDCDYSKEVFNFFVKVKKKHCNVNGYLEFFKVIKLYRYGKINRYELEIYIGKLFQMDGGLMIVFEDLIPSIEDNLF